MTASDGRTALQAFRRQRVDAVLLDLRLPDIGGLEVLRQMRALDPRVDVILVTAVNEIRTAVQAMRTGALDYITKPFETDDLLAVVAQAARRRCESREILLISRQIGVLTALVVVLERTVGTAVCLSPRAALTCLAGRRPSLVVLENSTGPPTTTDLINEILARYPACPILALTEPHGLGEMLEQVVVAMASVPDVWVAKPRVRHVVLAAAEQVSRRYREKLLGRDVAQSVGMTTDQLHRAFEQSLGVSVKDFVSRFRVSAACYLLADADFKLDHIADLTGFDDGSHLSRVFIRQRGMRPGAYRRQLGLYRAPGFLG